MTSAQMFTTKPGRSILLSTYVRDARKYGAKRCIGVPPHAQSGSRVNMRRVNLGSTEDGSVVGSTQQIKSGPAQRQLPGPGKEEVTSMQDNRTPVERRYDEMIVKYRDRSYVIQPGKHVGHVVQIREADPIDTGALRAHCSCGTVWAIDETYLRRAFGENIEVAYEIKRADGPSRTVEVEEKELYELRSRETDHQRAIVDVLNALDPKSGRVSEQDLMRARGAAARLITDEGRVMRDGPDAVAR